MNRITGADFDAYWQAMAKPGEDPRLMAAFQEILTQVRREGDPAVRLCQAQSSGGPAVSGSCL